MAVTQKSPKHYRFTFTTRLQNLCMDVISDLYLANETFVGGDNAREQYSKRIGFSACGHDRAAAADLSGRGGCGAEGHPAPAIPTDLHAGYHGNEPAGRLAKKRPKSLSVSVKRMAEGGLPSSGGQIVKKDGPFSDFWDCRLPLSAREDRGQSPSGFSTGI